MKSLFHPSKEGSSLYLQETCSSAKIRVLLIDDEPDVLDVTKIFLERSGDTEVLCCSSAREGLFCLQTCPVDIIVSDYEMPEINGIELLFTLRSSGNDLPFIIFTGRGREEVVIEALNTGATYYVKKGGGPAAQFAELSHLIRLALKQKKYAEGLLESRGFISHIFHHLPDATFAINTNGVVIAWNWAMEKMTGVSAGDIIGLPGQVYAIPFYGESGPVLADYLIEESESLSPAYTVLEREPGMIIAETCRASINDCPVILWVKATYLYDPQGKVWGVIESVRDVTVEKKAQGELVRLNHYHRSLIEAHIDPLITLTPDLIISDLNTAMEELIGQKKEELLDTSFCCLFTNPSLAEGACMQIVRIQAKKMFPLHIHASSGEVLVFLNGTVCKDLHDEACKIFVELHGFDPSVLNNNSLSHTEPGKTPL